MYKPKPSNRVTYDRFIPNHAAMNTDIAELKISSTAASAARIKSVTNGGKNTTYSDYVSAALFGQKVSYSADGRVENRILQFKPKISAPHQNTWDISEILYGKDYRSCMHGGERTVPNTPFKVLDAPGLSQDYYLNLLDWSEKNIVAVALTDVVYLWNASTGQIEPLAETDHPADFITSIRWSSDGDTLAVGTSYGQVKLYDVSTSECIRVMSSHYQRVGSLSWNGAIVSSGSYDSEIHNHDVRVRNHLTARLIGHDQEVCGLSWSPNGRNLASGGNDNLVHIWDSQHQSTSRWVPRHRFDRHAAAVKALAWCPWNSNLLATGGGTADKHIRFWNTRNGAFLREIDTEGQITSIVWNPHDHEILTTHGLSEKQLKLWKYPSLEKVAEISGHSDRILHAAINPEGTTVVTGENDEALRFWELFETPQASKLRLGQRKQARINFGRLPVIR